MSTRPRSRAKVLILLLSVVLGAAVPVVLTLAGKVSDFYIVDEVREPAALYDVYILDEEGAHYHSYQQYAKGENFGLKAGSAYVICVAVGDEVLWDGVVEKRWYKPAKLTITKASSRRAKLHPEIRALKGQALKKGEP